MRLRWLAVSVVLLEVAQLVCSQSEVGVTTSKGPIVGLRWDPNPRSQVSYDAFMGIPYGEIPARFQPPVPRTSWSAPLITQSDGPACPQLIMPFSEDCLYLNVYTPLNASATPGKFPVMAYIHGSSFTFGSGTVFLYGPDFIVPKGVILVVMNYRLGAAGFLSMGSPLAPGNLGLLDTRLALQWIQEEISVFGGDPDQVTLASQSAGSAMTMFHFFSPISSGLFHRIILHSGSPLGTWGHIMPDEAVRRAKLLADAVGCDSTLSDAEILTCLQETDINIIVGNQTIPLPDEVLASGNGLPFVPVIDTIFGDPPFFTDSIENLLKQSVKNPKPMIAGFTTEEGIFMFLDSNWKLTGSNMKGFKPWSMKTEPNELQKTLIEEKVRSKYMPDTVEGNKILDIVYLFTDYMIAYPLIETIRQFSDSTYAYVFAYNGPWAPIPAYFTRFHVTGVYHGADLLYIFYHGQDLSPCRSNLPNLAVRDNMVRYWTDFVKGGVPDSMGVWKTASNGQYLSIDSSISTINSSQVEEQHYAFWADFHEFDADSSDNANSALSLNTNLLHYHYIAYISYLGYTWLYCMVTV